MLTADLALALDIADRAGGLALDYFQRGVHVRTKPDDSPVSEADLAVETQIREALGAAFPGDELLGEELGRSGNAERTWLIDPIDGTRAFVAANPDWRIHLALEVGGRVDLAVVVAPALGMCWWATRGGGAFQTAWPRSGNAARALQVSDTADLDHATVEAWPMAGEAAGLRHVAVEPTSITPLRVAQGALDAFVVCCCEPWDHAPWTLIVPEAGGRFTDWSGGESSHNRGGIFSNASLHASLVNLVLH